jgi:hypothetical protein
MLIVLLSVLLLLLKEKKKKKKKKKKDLECYMSDLGKSCKFKKHPMYTYI